MNLLDKILKKLGIGRGDIFKIPGSSKLYSFDLSGDLRTPKDDSNATGFWEVASDRVLDEILQLPQQSIYVENWIPRIGHDYFVVLEDPFIRKRDISKGLDPREALVILHVSCWKNSTVERGLMLSGMIFSAEQLAKAHRLNLCKRYPTSYAINKDTPTLNSESIIRAFHGEVETYWLRERDKDCM